MFVFRNVSILLPTLNETFSFEKTVDIITTSCNPQDVHEIIAIVCERTLPESIESIQKAKAFAEERGFKLHILEQQTPFAGGAVRDGMMYSSGSHIIMMAPDLETDPNLVPELIESAKQYPSDITTASRWLSEDAFEGYSKVKLILNKIFQAIARIWYGTKLTDVTFGYRIAPADVFQSIDWEEQKHPFFLETALKPLRLGIKFHELPTVWKCREEGESQNSLAQTFKYIKIAVKARFIKKSKLLKGGMTIDQLESQQNTEP